MASQAAPLRVVFTDLDGTIIHYPGEGGLATCRPEDAADPQLIRLPPTHSGAVGVISAGTLRLFAALRSLGIRLVLISGARSSTLLHRLPYLPAADAYVCESGGRIFLPDPAALTAAALSEDLAWRRRHEAVTGPLGQDALPPAQRSGTLWQHFVALQAQGWSLDAASYTTAFRVRPTPSKSAADVAALRAGVPAGLAAAGNLGATDFFPTTSGKENTARYLMGRFGADADQCVLLCDDDNDLALAAAVRKAYLPGITADSVRAAVEAAPERFYVSSEAGWRGTEEILRRLVREQVSD